MKPLFLLFVTLFYLSPFTSYSQRTVNTTFVFPHANEYEIRIDEEKVFNQNQISLRRGEHTVEIWIPAFEIIYDTIYVHPDSLNSFQYRTKRSEEYKTYKEAKSEYNQKAGVVSILPITHIASLGYATYQWFDAKNLAERYEQKIVQYQAEKDISLTLKYKGELDAWHSEYVKKQRIYNTTLIVCGVLAVSSVVAIWRFRKKYPKPNPTYLNSPFVSNNLTLSIAPTTYGLGLKLNL